MRSETRDPNAYADKLFALAECLLFLVIFLIFAWYFETIYGAKTYGWYSKVIMIFLGLLGIFLHGNPRQYGLIPKNIKFSLEWSARIFLLFLSLGIFGVVISVFLGIANLSVDVSLVLIDFLWYFVFVGFAEELFFRGFIQSRLNEVFTKKYRRILNVEFEWTQGTLITAVFFFGLPHLFVMVNPFTGEVMFSAFYLMIALVFAPFLGLIFGVIREKTGGILISITLHAMIDFVTLSIGRVTGIEISGSIVFLALFIFFRNYFGKILRSDI